MTCCTDQLIGRSTCRASARATTAGQQATPSATCPQLGQNIGQGMSLGQHQPHPAVAGEIARAGQHQIAHAGKAQEGLGLGALRQTEAGDFGQTAREQCRTGIEAQPQTVADAGGHGP